VLSSAEHGLERCRGDGGRNLIVLFEEVLVAGDDVVGLVLSCQRNEVVIVGVSGCSNDRDWVVDEVAMRRTVAKKSFASSGSMRSEASADPALLRPR